MMHNQSYAEQVVEAWEDGYKKGLLTFWVLLSLHNGSKHMRQIKHYIEFEATTNLTVDEKSLYRSVNRFKKMGLIKSHDEPSDNGGPPLKLYDLTPQGKDALELFYERNIKQIFLTNNFRNETKGL